ncbi:MAG: SDR family oxidoreductase [Spirochaetaceae bacterium]|nr:MAG: SDR family oxidoreductase [Spirochaetaceae bacterium]
MATACVTGASSGIGRSFAEQLAARGYDLIVTGRRLEKLEELERDLAERYGVTTEIRLLELSDRNALEDFAAELATREDLGYLVNNAGYGRGESFTEDSFSEHERMLAVHVTAPMRLAHAVAPVMKAAGSGVIVNVSSLASLLSSRSSLMYCATKACLNSFSESLALELGPHGVHVQLLLPGFTHTEFHRDSEVYPGRKRNRLLLRWMPAPQVVRLALRDIDRGRTICVPGRANKLLQLLARQVPRGLRNKLSSGGISSAFTVDPPAEVPETDAEIAEEQDNPTRDDSPGDRP